MLTIQLLGSPVIRLPNGSTPTFKTAKAEGLLYYLTTTQSTHSRAALATLFWGEMDEAKARINLSKALSELREQMGEYVTIGTQTVAFNVALPYQLDVEAFYREIAREESAASIATLQAQNEQYCGDFLAGFHVRNAPDFEQWLLTQREHLRTIAAQRIATLAKRYQQTGQWANAIATCRRLLALEPWREETHEQLMHLLIRNGEPHAALRQYERCRLALADELAVEPGESITRLYTELRGNGDAAAMGESATAAFFAQASAVVSPELATPRHQLPQPATAFVGRTAEINALIARLQEPPCRLLTLIGPGGIGKTRLALEVARHFVDRAGESFFPDGIFFVNLMPVESAAGMVATIAEAIGFAFYNNTVPQQQLFNYLEQRKLLLLLDNFEQLTQASALVAELLAAAPAVKLLVTSRDAMPLQAAYFHAVQGLAYPSTQQATTDAATLTDAVRLFAQSAQRHQAAFALAPNLADVAAICRLVGGLPLALELAAAWLKSLSCAQIAHELKKGAALLQTNLADIPARHRNMHMVFEQSWQRLTGQEAAVLARLAHFRGGFTLAAAEAVAQASLPTLAALSEKALIQLDETGRYQLHELLRQFAHEKLAANPVALQATAVVHADFFLTLAAQLKGSLEDKRQQAALTSMQSDIDNLRVAWMWGVQQATLPNVAQVLDSIYLFFLFTCRYNEGQELFSTSGALLEQARIQDNIPATTALATCLASRAAVFTFQLGEYEQPSHHFRALLAAARPDEATHDIAIAHAVLGQIAGWQGDHNAADVHLRDSIALYQTLGDRSSLASVLHTMAEMQAHAGEFQKALDYAQECLAIGVQLRRNDLIGNAHCTLGYASKSLGYPTLALDHYRQGAVYSEKSGDRLAYALAVGGVGIELCQLGEEQWPTGFKLIQESLAICRAIGHLVHIVTRLFSLGQVCIFGARYHEALPYGEECIQLATEVNLAKAHMWGVSVLGEAYLLLGDYVSSRLYLISGVQISLQSDYYTVTHYLIVYALLLEQEAYRLAPDVALQNRRHAVTLAAAALRHRAWHQYHQTAAALVERLRAILAPNDFAAAQELAEQHSLAVLATKILEL